MSAANGIDADNQALTKFDHYGDLPPELKIKIIHEFLAAFPKKTRPLAPFAALHSEWQHELEPDEELWGKLSLTTNDLPAYRSMLNPLRGDSLFHVELKILIDDEAIDPAQQSHGVLSRDNVRSRVHGFVVHSVSTLFECVDYAKSTGPQPARQGVDLSTYITIPVDGIFGERRGVIGGIEFDFSSLSPTTAIRGFIQESDGLRRKEPKHWQILDLESRSTVLLNRSSLLSLVGRMPNLETAVVFLHTKGAVSVTTAPQVNICPRLKTLELFPNGTRLPGSVLSRWTINWSHKIERLRLGRTANMPAFFRSLAADSSDTSTVSWPNLQVLELNGFYDIHLEQASKLDELGSILSAMAAALISLPSIRDITINLRSFLHVLPRMVTALRFCGDSSELTILTDRSSLYPFMPVTISTLGGGDIRTFTEPPGFWELASKDAVRSAVADMQAAVETQRGQYLKVVLPEKDDEPESL